MFWWHRHEQASNIQSKEEAEKAPKFASQNKIWINLGQSNEEVFANLMSTDLLALSDFSDKFKL